MSEKDKSIIYDFAFIGLGASNSLILLSLTNKGLLKNKKVVVFETFSKTINDKTYCFWAGASESIVADLAPIISYRFNSIQVSQSVSKNIDSQPYHYIRSIDLYNYTLKLIIQEQIKIHRVSVHKITFENEISIIHDANETYKTNYIFDSRPPNHSIIDKNQICLEQSFFGLHIKCENDVFTKNTFEMMNFNVDQSNYTQFVYVIPFSSNEALVELTRFGKDKIDKSYAMDVLNNFISRDFGKFETMSEEIGCIPMTTFINPPNSFKGILNTGASANLIKPSTGYGFKKMHEFAEVVTERIASNDFKNFNKISLPAKKRFIFYDKLLLLILMYWPSKGKLIFSRLFEKQSIPIVFSFLDEKSSILQELKIFASLPLFIFLKALYHHFKRENWLRYIIALLIVVAYIILYYWNVQYAMYISYLTIIIGLLLIGIPHGALDHMLSINRNRPILLFILKYSLVIGLYYVFWQFFPLLALIVFIIYSSFHFGESEMISTGIKVDSLFTHFKAFLMGLSILLFIIFTHLEESIVIISNFISVSELTYFELNFTPISWIVAILSFIYIFTQYIKSNSWVYIGLLFLLILGVKVPLILAFGFYFIFQHSSNVWQHLKLGLNLNSTQLYKKSSFYTLGALVIFILIAFYGNEVIAMKGLVRDFFIFLACISFPHFILMHVFYKTKIQ